ncbi:hypothetical protein [Ralstonia flaminis]|jgi:hypothetical protein|uniref:Uncharacterized protein n=1 Tax=Ralstonia flaminis TaxID=3058597 RepID=A0ABM9K2M9_9RALS|nr:hypothetical protein [Ralstonia sp. LMG 18101]CAJ0812914.1 hypothetical protein LMG18101_01731 [Ralstonia sp. LMG 18101]
MAGFKVFNDSDQSIWVTIYDPFGQQIGYGNVDKGKNHEFTSGFYAIGSQYKLLAEYPTAEPHRWTTTTRQYLTKTDHDSIHLRGDASGGHWHNP